MGRLIICYKKYESTFQKNDTEYREWVYYLGTLEQFELEHPTYKVILCFMPEDNLLR